jgi:hypothetical protein
MIQHQYGEYDLDRGTKALNSERMSCLFLEPPGDRRMVEEKERRNNERHGELEFKRVYG